MGKAHPDTVKPHEPRSRLPGVLHDPGVGRAVLLVGEPAVSARFVRPRLVAALEGEVLHVPVFVLQRLFVRVFEGWRLAVIACWAGEPSLVVEYLQRRVRLVADPGRPRPDPERRGGEYDGTHREFVAGGRVGLFQAEPGLGRLRGYGLLSQRPDTPRPRSS